MPWRSQLADNSIDAIVAAAPPDATTEVALSCAAAGKPVMATKPLWDHPERITAPFYVDFWRLWSAAHVEARDSGRYVHFTLVGNGPFRDFPGGLDYGPHVMAAAMYCLGTDLEISSCYRHSHDDYVDWPGNGGEHFTAELYGGARCAHISFGNGHPSGCRMIEDAEEDSLTIGTEPKVEILQRFCQSFLNDISEGFADTRLLELSHCGMAALRKIRDLAK